ncbi:hypothetical protein WG954_18940 [Lacibacter sp. H375]|uniref:hypothetical protein n=1 Tax=Lacibacter sp. H375 TaxID=3133424 RepID=UPI0030BE6260
MRFLIILLLSFFVSCKFKIDTNDVLGSWTIEQDELKYPKTGFSDKATFFPNDSLRVEMFRDGKLDQFFVGTYKMDNERNTITTKLDTLEVEFEIVTLSEKKLVLKDRKRKTITNYKRL